MKDTAKLIGSLIAFILIIWLYIHNARSDREYIRQWAAENQMTEVTSIHATTIDNGPFWIRDDEHRIYRVEVIDHLEKPGVVYFRFGGWFGPDIEWDD